MALFLLAGGHMMDIALSIFALVAGGLTLELFAAASPPVGLEDRRGLPFGVEVVGPVEEQQIGNPS